MTDERETGPGRAPSVASDLPTAAGVTAPSAPPAMPTAANAAIPATAPPAMPTAAGITAPSAPPAMPTAAGITAPSAPPAMPEVTVPGRRARPASEGAVMATLVGDSRTDRDGKVLAPPSIPPARYVLGAEIARGGMGRVVEATDTYLGRVVALKEALATDAESLERFARETRITARLEHPSIVPVHDGGKGANGMPYYVMRKIEGRPLERMVMEADTLADRLRLVPHLVQSAQAIAHAHERGIVHRDIKPSNILVGELGETIVIDWGLAKVIGEADEPSAIHGVPLQPVADGDTIKTRAGIVFGTPGFMAPEQLRGGPCDPRWDVYALGATLYHLLSRKPPHHAKTADEMMRAAVNAPPAPIGELVPGVPPELSTIIDKALAFDPERRYQDARELAEDLQRFLGGQLVASHHYTAWERVQRYIHQHRVAFLVGAVAAAAMMIGGALAFVRIVNERDRADANAVTARKAQKLAEDQRAEAERRADELSLSSARNVASTNPTYALTLIKPLVAKRWREVRAIAAEARAAGVAWGLPASPSMRSLQFSRDGLRVLGAGDDGVVRLYDLEARAARTVLEAGGPVAAVFAGDEKQIVVWAGAHVGTVDLATGAKRDLEVAMPIVALEVIGTTAYWIDANAALWSYELGAAAPLQIPLDESVAMLVASPTGRYLALGGVDHFMLYDRTQPAEPAKQVFRGTAHAIDWARDGTHVGVLHDDQAVDVTLEDDAPRVWHRLTVGERSHVVQGADALYTIGPTGVGMVSASLSRPRKQLAKPIGLEEARGGAIIAGGEDQLVVLTEHGDHTIAAPSGRFSLVRASPASPYVVATLDDRLLVWNLDVIEPRVAGTQIATARFVTGDDLVATTLDGAAWVDLRSGAARPLGTWPPLLDVAASPAGQYALAIDVAHRGHLITATKPPVDLAGAVDRAGFPSDAQLVVATDEGAIDLVDVATAQRAPLYAHTEAPLASLAWSPAWVAAQFADGVVWRTSLATRTPETLRAPRTPTSNLRVLAAGDAFVAIGTELHRWRPGDRALVHQATLPKKITRLGSVGEAQLVAFADDGAAYVIDLAAPDRVTDLEETLGRTSASMSPRTGLVATLERGAIDILDPLIKPARWHLALASSATYTDVQISADGRRVLAKTGSTLLVWDLALPQDATDTAAWLEEMTNAVAGSGAKSLGWR